METQINISRPVYDNAQFNETFNQIHKQPKSYKDSLKRCAKKVSCSGASCRKALLARLPIINTLRTYNPRGQLLGDAIAGLSVGIIHIAQGMGFAIMAGVPPIYGLYGAFWPAFLYVFFGTGHHVALGTMALISIMIRTVVDREVALLGLPSGDQQGNETLNILSLNLLNTSETSTVQSPPLLNTLSYSFMTPTIANGSESQPFDLEAFQIGVTMSLSLMVGLMQFAMGVLRLGVVSTFMPTPFIGGLTTGAAIHIVTSQMQFVLGIKGPRRDGLFKLPLIWYDLALLVPKIKPAEVIIAIICMVIILLIKYQINARFKEKMIAPIPPELVVVVIACLVSHFANLHGRFGVRIIKHIPSGMLPPVVPSMAKFTDFIPDAIMISLISFSIAFSMGSLFGAKHNYTVDSNQELIALGISHTVASFFGGFAGTAAPPRCFILDVTGATTQVSGIVTSIFLLFVIFLMGPLFAPLPNSILGAVIIVAVLPLFVQFLSLKTLWRVNKYDFSIWMVSWIAVTFLDISLGVVIGIVFSIITLVIQMYTSKGVTLATLANDDIFVPAEKYNNIKSQETVQIFQFQGNLIFVSKDKFKSQIEKLLKNVPQTESIQKSDIQQNGNATELKVISDKTVNLEENANDVDKLLVPKSYFIVLDFSKVSYIDIMGLTTLKKVHSDCAKAGVKVVLACVSHSVFKTLEKSGGKWNDGEDIRPYPSLVDAVMTCTQTAKTHL